MFDKILVIIEFVIGTSFALDKVFFGIGFSMFVLENIIRNGLGKHHRHWTFYHNKFEKFLFFVGIILGISGGFLKYSLQAQPNPATRTWGVTFSQKMSTNLGLDWKENYEAVVSDLHPQGLRLIAYWDLTEPQENQWNFDDLDFQVHEARRTNIPVILALGQKTPRWPECHLPDFAKGYLNESHNFISEDSEKKYHDALLNYVRTIVERYRGQSEIKNFQVENEPFFGFGECPPANPDLLREEVALVKSLDPSRQVMTTDSGELGTWYKAAGAADILGTTLYQRVYNNAFDRLVRYPLSPEFYELKAQVAKRLAKKPDERFMIAELDAEPWGKQQIYDMPLETQLQLFTPTNLQEAIDFASKTKFDSAYFWGVEWWYSAKKQGHPEYWNAIKDLTSSHS